MSTTTTPSAIYSLKMIDDAMACLTARIEDLDAQKAQGIEIDRYLRDVYVDARGFARDVKNAMANSDADDYNAKLVECALACHDMQTYLQDRTDVSYMYVYNLKAAIAAARHAIVDPISLC